MKKFPLRIFTFFMVFTVFCLHSFGQQPVTGSVTGSITDTTGKQSLNGATIALFDLNDSNAAPKYGQAKARGAFELKNIAEGRYRLLITFEGYENQSKFFAATKENPVISLGNIVMMRKSAMLQEVIVTKPPITIKKDTVEFNADSYKTKPNAVAEDLFKKLPGVAVDKSGTITAQGEQVTRILVDGKRFFSDDPKLASKNLPPDVIDKIQVFDDLSDQSKFTGFDDGNRVKTINIVTKKDKRKGYFGKVQAGAGTNENYDNNVNIHRFNGNQQISLLAQANDVNKQNFSIQDLLGTSGTNGRGGGGGVGGGRTGGGAGTSSGGSGITTIWAGGMNYRDNWSPTTQAYGSYFFNSQHVSTNQQSLTQNIYADSSTFNDQNSSSIRRNQNNRINFNVEQQLDSNNSLIFRPNVGFQHTTTNASQQTMYTSGTEKGTPVYNTNSSTTQANDGNNGNYDLLFRHKFAKKFRTLSFDANVQNSLNNGVGTNYAINSHFFPVYTIDTLNQHIITGSTSLTVSPTLSYTEPIGKNQILEFNYNYTYSKNTSERYTYSLNNLSSKYDAFDSLYSNAFINTNYSNRFTLNYRIQRTKYNLSVGSGLQARSISSINTTKITEVDQHYINLTPTVNFQYLFSKTSNFRVNYSGRTGQPSISQLQPIVTTNDSINFTQGNPNLKPQFTHSMRLLYTNFNTVTQRVMFATINASMITNDIQSSIVSKPNGSQLSTSVNLNGTFSLNGYFNYGFALKKPKSNLNFITNASYGQSQTLVNAASDYARNTALGETISWTTNLKDNFDMNLRAGTTYNIVRNSLRPTLNSNYSTEVLSAEITWYTKSGWLVAADLDYTYNGSRPPGYTSSVPLLNPAIAKQIFKNKQGEIRLSVFDLLNQNVAVARNITANYIQDTKTNVLTRYAMLTFTYNLRKFAGQGQKMPGMFRGMRNGMRNAPGGFDGGGGGGQGGGRRNN